MQPVDEVLDYIKLSFKVDNGTVYRVDDYIGSINSHGYRQFKVNWDTRDSRITVSAHHISWYLHKGVWPVFELDHIDKNKENNDIENLREVTYREQFVNTTNVTEKKSDLPTGVKFKKGRYEVYIRINGKKAYIGSSKCPIEAGKMYQEYFEALNKFEKGEI